MVSRKGQDVEAIVGGGCHDNEADATCKGLDAATTASHRFHAGHWSQAVGPVIRVWTVKLGYRANYKGLDTEAGLLGYRASH